MTPAVGITPSDDSDASRMAAFEGIPDLPSSSAALPRSGRNRPFADTADDDARKSQAINSNFHMFAILKNDIDESNATYAGGCPISQAGHTGACCCTSCAQIPSWGAKSRGLDFSSGFARRVDWE